MPNAPQLSEELFRRAIEVLCNLWRGDRIVKRSAEIAEQILKWRRKVLPMPIPSIVVKEEGIGCDAIGMGASIRGCEIREKTFQCA
jgi:hypothetical protein